MALAVPFKRNDWSNPLWDQREQSRETRRVSETSESSEEGWAQSEHAGPSNESEDSLDQDGLEDSYNDEEDDQEEDEDDDDDEEEEEDDDDDDDDDDYDDNDEGGPYKNTVQFAAAGKARCVFTDEITRVEAITKCKGNESESSDEEDEEEESDTDDSDTDDSDAEYETDESEEEDEEEDYCELEVDYEDDEEDSDDEEETKLLYQHTTYTTDVFQSMENFRDSNFLIDLFLSTQDGHTLHAHSPVIGAVSSVVLQKLRIQWEWSHSNIYLSLEPEVTHRGVAAVLEFAYTGCIPTLCTATIDNIQAAARALGVPRVLELCRLKQEEEQKPEKKEEKEVKETEEEGEEEERSLSPAEELKITLQSMRDLWVEKAGCDIMLQADCQIFPAHRVILAASSDYFRGMFSSGMKETRQWVVTLKSMGEDELEAFLISAYSGSLALNWSVVFDLICAAFQFQVQPALSLCLDFLYKEIDANSCLDVASFAEAYGIGNLLQLADDFVLRHFPDVAATPKFQHLSKYKLLRFLQSNALCVPSEIVVLRAVLSWISACPRGRVRVSRDLINAIKFPLLTFKEFNEAQEIVKLPQKNMKRLYEFMVEEFCSQEVDKKDQFRDYLPKGNLVLVGGEGITPDLGNRKTSRELWFSKSLRNHTGIVKEVEWKFLAKLPEKPRFCHEVAVLDDMLYVCGGRHYYGEMDIMNSMFRYDPVINRWKKLADMQEARCLLSMVVLDGMIYVMGGEKTYKVSVDSVERYCPKTNSWSFACPLDQPMSGHAATVWGGNIYISGGLNCEYQCLVSMFLYHPEKGTTYLADMPHNRAQHRMESLGDYLYVAGGISADGSDNCFDQLLCEMYSPESDCWFSIAPLPMPHVGAASAVMEDKLYILGGYSQVDYSECELIHRYDPALERWENMGEMPGPKSEIRACLLRLPESLKA